MKKRTMLLMLLLLFLELCVECRRRELVGGEQLRYAARGARMEEQRAEWRQTDR